jgi:hypothetical protein
MLTHFENEIKVFAPSRLLQKEFVHHSGKRDGVMPADVRRNGVSLCKAFESTRDAERKTE